MSVWSISLEYDEPRIGDITRLTYTSANDLVTFQYRVPFTGAPGLSAITGFEGLWRFEA